MVGVFAGVASASTTEEQAYLEQLGKGFSSAHPKTDDQLITLGHDACTKIGAAVAKGNYQAEKFDSDFAVDKSVSIEVTDATKLREAAIKNLCPDAVKGATTGEQGAQSNKAPAAPAGKDGAPSAKSPQAGKEKKPAPAGVPGLDTGSSGGGNKPAK